jgi:hypothetical protein
MAKAFSPITRNENRRLRQHRQHRRRPQGLARSGTGCPNQSDSRRCLADRGEDWSQTLLTVLTVPARVARILIILLPARPSRLNVLLQCPQKTSAREVGDQRGRVLRPASRKRITFRISKPSTARSQISASNDVGDLDRLPLRRMDECERNLPMFCDRLRNRNRASVRRAQRFRPSAQYTHRRVTSVRLDISDAACAGRKCTRQYGMRS